jgi:nicotinamidase-related amidase
MPYKVIGTLTSYSFIINTDNQVKGNRKTRSMNNNPANLALLVIDVQQGLFRKSTPIYQADELLENINLLVDRAHAVGVPVFYIQHSDSRTLVKGSQDWQLHPELQPQRRDTIVHKLHGNAYEDTNLDSLLKSKNISRLIVAGLVTHGCVKATCLGARQLGYTVILVKDGHSSYSKDAGRLIEEWNQKLATQGCELLSTSQVEFS